MYVLSVNIYINTTLLVSLRYSSEAVVLQELRLLQFLSTDMASGFLGTGYCYCERPINTLVGLLHDLWVCYKGGIPGLFSLHVSLWDFLLQTLTEH